MRPEALGAARHNVRLPGKAIDIRIPKVGIPSLREAALRLQEGGSGYHMGSWIVHIESGRFRLTTYNDEVATI